MNIDDAAPRHDAVVPFIFEKLPVRGAIVHLGATWQRMQQDHNYQGPIQSLLGHAAAATALIAQNLKNEGTVTMQLHGDGPLKMLVMQCSDQLYLRGMASVDADEPAMDGRALLSNTRCAVTVDSGNVEQPYQGIVEVNPDSLALSLENYFNRSVQVPSRLVLIADEARCPGILLQQMPGRGEALEDDWRRLSFLADTLRLDDVHDGVGLALIHKLFNEDDVRVYKARRAGFRCRCSRSRSEAVLRMLGEEETRAVCEERGAVDVTCEYCGKRQGFDSVDVSRIFADSVAPAPGTIQ